MLWYSLVKVQGTLTGWGGLGLEPWVGDGCAVTKCLMDVVYCYSVHHAKQMAPGGMEPLPV